MVAVPGGARMMRACPGASRGGSGQEEAMTEQTLDRVARALATGLPRRAVLKTVAAAGGGGVVAHFTGDESAARLSRCCRERKRTAKALCSVLSSGDCPRVRNFSCVKTGPGECNVN